MFRWNRWVIFLAAWFLFVGTADAHAFFLVPLFTAIGSVLAWLGPIGQAILGIAIKVGLSLIEKAKQKQVQEPGVQIQIETGGDNPLSFIMGPFADAGQLEYVNTWGHADKTPNAYVTDVISLGDLPLHQIIGCFVDDTRITIPTMTGSPPTVQGWPVAEYNEDGHDYLWMNWHDGRQTTVDTFLLGKFSTDPDRPWTSAMVGFGVPYVTMTARVNQRLFPGGRPKYLFETDGIALYDIRKDSTAGGSGSHRWTDQTTWEVSDNNIVQAYNIIRGIHYGTEWVYGGQTTQGYQLPAANWMAAMNACDTLISLVGGGTEKQYRSGCRVAVDQEPAGVVESILKGASGRIAEVGGMYKVTVGAPGAAIYSFTDASVVVSEGQTFDPFPGLEQTFNGAQASYPEPLEKWASKDAPAYYRADLEVLDDNRRLVTGLTFPTVPYAVQIQRLLKEAIDDSRRFRQHMFYLPPEAWLLEPGDIVAWTSAHNSYTDKKFIVISIEGGSNFLQLVMLKEVDPADFVWNPLTDQHAYSIGFIGQIVPAPQPMSGWQVFPANLVDSTGNARRPSMEVRFDGDLDDVQYARIQTRLASTMELVFDSPCPYGDPTTNSNPMSVILNGSFLPLTNYEVRGRFLPYSTRPTEWSAWLPVTTDDTRFAALDIGDHVISITHFASGITPVELFATTPSNADPANFEGRQVFNTTDGLLYTFKSGAWTLTVSSNILAGSITNAQIANAAIDASKLATGAVTALKIAAAAVTSTAIATGAVLTAALAANAVTVAAIANDAVTNAKILNAAVDAAKLAAGAVTLTKFASGLTPVEILGTLPVTGNFDGRLVFLTTDKKLYRYNATAAAFQASVAAVDLTGQITTTQITNNAITTPLILAGAITTAKIAAGAVTATEIAADTITAGQIAAGAITASEIAANAVTATAIAANTITSAKMVSGSITARELILTNFENILPDNQMQSSTSWGLSTGWTLNPTGGGGLISTGAITYSVASGLDINSLQSQMFPLDAGATYYMYANCFSGAAFRPLVVLATYDGSGSFLGFTSLSNSGVTTGGSAVTIHELNYLVPSGTKLGALIFRQQIGTSNMVVGSGLVRKKADANLIVNGAITTLKLAAGSVTAAAIAAGTITATEIATGTITAGNIASGAITTVKIQAGAVVAASISAGTITSDKMVAGSITARELILTNFDNIIPDNQMQSAAAWSLATGWSILPTSGGGLKSVGAASYNVASGLGTNGLQSQLFPLDAGYTYYGYVNVFSSATWTATVALATYDGSAAFLGFTAFSNSSVSQSAGVSAYEVHFAVPSGTKYGALIVRQDAGTANILAGSVLMKKKADANLIVDGSITTSKLLANAVTAAKIAANTITAGQIAAGAISATELAAGAITAGKIAAGAISTSTLFVNGVIVTGNMANNAVIDSAAKVTLAPTVLTVNAGFVDMLTINIPLRDNTNAVELTFFLSATTTGGPSGSASAQARVVRRVSGVDTVIAETQWPGGGAGAGSTITYTALPASYSDDAAPAAAYSYKLQYSGAASGGGSAVNVSGTMVAKWWKR